MPVPVEYLLARDAYGVGAFLGDFSQEMLLSVPFTLEQMLQSSTCRELYILLLLHLQQVCLPEGQDCPTPV